jgi:hypothetical protein
MFHVRVKEVAAVKYVSRSGVLAPDEIDSFVTEAIRELEQKYAGIARPFSVYHGCDKDERQLVEVCLPTPEGNEELDGGRVAYTVARRAECEYPQITEAYDAVARFISERGLASAGVPRETYLTPPDAAEPEMEIAFPLSA